MGFLASTFQQQAAKTIYRRGISCEQKQSYAQAVETLTEAIEKGYAPVAEALIHRGINRVNIQDIEGAIADFETVIHGEQGKNQSSPRFVAEALFHRGQLHWQQNREAATTTWTAAIQCCPTYAPPYYHRALFQIEKDNPHSALLDLNAAIENEPSMAIAYLQRGNLRHRLGDTLGAISDWQYAIYDSATFAKAKQALEEIQHDDYQTQLSQVLANPFAEKELTVKVQHRKSNYKNNCLDIYACREMGKGVNYYALPDLIRQHLVPLHIAGITRFRLVGQVAGSTRPDWDQSYDLYKNQPCPPSNWHSAILAIVLFPPLAIPAFIQAASVKRAYRKGKYVEALNASKLVTVFSIASSIPFSFLMFLSISYAGYEKTREQVNVVTSEPSAHSVSYQTSASDDRVTTYIDL